MGKYGEKIVMDKQAYHIHISSNHRWFDINLKEIWQYRDLILLFTKRDFTLRYKQTILGPIWIFLNPFLTSVVYAFMFGGIAGISTDSVPQILFYLCSNALWGMFSECLNKNSSTFVANAAVFGKVYFPRITVAIANAFSAIIRFGIQMIMVVLVLIYYVYKGQVQPNWSTFIFIPAVLLQLAILGTGIGILVSSITTKYRDLLNVVGFIVSLMMYAAPIVYPLSQLQTEWMQVVVLLNPVTASVELFRYAVLGKGTVVLASITLSWIITITVMLFGIIVFSRVEKNFMDTV